VQSTAYKIKANSDDSLTRKSTVLGLTFVLYYAKYILLMQKRDFYHGFKRFTNNRGLSDFFLMRTLRANDGDFNF
jgi:hypothetical protein